MKIKIFAIGLGVFLFLSFSAKLIQERIYDTKLIQTQVLQIKVDGQSDPIVKEPYAILKMSNKGDRVKLKYFAAKSSDGSTIASRFKKWASNKNIIALTSGTYMDNCNAAIAKPMGLCIDDGYIVNNKMENGYNGLIIVNSKGELSVSALEKDNFPVNYKTLDDVKFDIRIPKQKEQFIIWSKEQRASVFQTHLFVYKDSLRIFENPYEQQIPKARRFLVICKAEDSTIYHYIINLPKASTLYRAVINTKNYLKDIEEVSQIIALLNLDTGCQNFYSVSNPDGTRKKESYFYGYPNINIDDIANLLVYYYE